MSVILGHALANLGRARDMAGLAQSLSSHVTPAVDTTDILRAALVMAVSALDHYVHEATRVGMLDVASGSRRPTASYNGFRVSMAAVSSAGLVGGLGWLDQEIRDRHGWLTFQQPDKIADAVRLFSSVELWSVVAKALGTSTTDVKSTLRLIVERRNKIAHEADTDPTVPGTRWPISYGQVDDSVVFLESLVVAIDAACA